VCLERLRARRQAGGDGRRGGQGGTFIRPLGRVAKIGQGTALVHSSSIWHAGHPIGAGTRVILVCFLLSTAHPENMRRFQERAARLRNEGMLTAAKAAVRMAAAVEEQHRYPEDVIHKTLSGLGMPPPNDDLLFQFKVMGDKMDELWQRHRERVRLLSLLRLKIGVLHWWRGELGEAALGVGEREGEGEREGGVCVWGGGVGGRGRSCPSQRKVCLHLCLHLGLHHHAVAITAHPHHTLASAPPPPLPPPTPHFLPPLATSPHWP